MYQQEIKFFWPLTEQIPLELDFEGCDKPRFAISNTGVSGTVLSVNGCSNLSWSSTVSTTGVEIRAGTITITEMPMPWYRKALFKLIGFKWE